MSDMSKEQRDELRRSLAIAAESGATVRLLDSDIPVIIAALNLADRTEAAEAALKEYEDAEPDLQRWLKILETERDQATNIAEAAEAELDRLAARVAELETEREQSLHRGLLPVPDAGCGPEK